MKEDYQKPLKNLYLLYFFFRTQSLLMDKIIKNKRGLELVTSLPSGHKTSSDFELFQKSHLQIYECQFMTQIIPLPFVLLNHESAERQVKNHKI